MPRPNRASLTLPAEQLAPALIGVVLVRVLENGARLAGRIVETEAYLGVKDRAAHSFGGRRTPRNEAMYRRAGTAYVYFTYGMHFCMNVVCGREDEPVAVLVRALEPLEGIEEMTRRRGGRKGRVFAPHELCSGPGKLCEALHIGRSQNGVDLLESDELFLEMPTGTGVPEGRPRADATGERLTGLRLGRSARVGIDSAGSWARRRLRWFEAGNPCVSRGPRPTIRPTPPVKRRTSRDRGVERRARPLIGDDPRG